MGGLQGGTASLGPWAMDSWSLPEGAGASQVQEKLGPASRGLVLTPVLPAVGAGLEAGGSESHTNDPPKPSVPDSYGKKIPAKSGNNVAFDLASHLVALGLSVMWGWG